VAPIWDPKPNVRDPSIGVVASNEGGSNDDA
jgi:hypothetical protein